MDGVIILNKPAGITSFRAVSIVKRLSKAKKVGHAGTLDPMATGILIICLGKACKLASTFMQSNKQYLAEITFGTKTDSGDSSGKVIETGSGKTSKENVKEILKKFLGETKQIPPMISALHHNGKRLYELARDGVVVDREARVISIEDIQLVDFVEKDNCTAKILVTCSKGTYIRTLAEDIGASLGLFAHMSSLVRTKSGKYDISISKTLEEIEEICKNNRLEEVLINEY